MVSLPSFLFSHIHHRLNGTSDQGGGVNKFLLRANRLLIRGLRLGQSNLDLGSLQ